MVVDDADSHTARKDPHWPRSRHGNRPKNCRLLTPGEGETLPLASREEIHVAAAKMVESYIEGRLGHMLKNAASDQTIARAMNDRHAARRRFYRPKYRMARDPRCRRAFED